jgi:anti-sigma regulatory factor (Ser/Thr protein kinase)
MVATIALEIPPRSAYVGVVRLALASLARSAGIDEETIEHLKIAVSEACSNAVLAHEQLNLDEPVNISWTEEAGRFVVEVEDKGSNYETEPSFDSHGIATRLAMSAALLGALVDECTFEPLAEGGTSARLVLNKQPAAPLSDNG